MKHVKKKLALLLVAVWMLSLLTACGGGSDSDADSQAEGEEDGDAQVTEVDYATLSDEELQALYEQEEASQRTIHIGYDGGLCAGGVALAYYLGFYEDEGLDVELTASEDARDALATGLIDTSSGMIAQWLTAVQNGVDIRFCVGLHTGCSSVVTLPDGPDEFEPGMTIGVSGAVGGPQHNIVVRMISHAGYTPEDFTFLPFDGGAILLALQNGEVDAIGVPEQLSLNWVNEGTVKMLCSLTTDEDFKDEACCVMGISGIFQDANPVASYKIARAVYRTSMWIAESEENRAEAAKILVENGCVSCTEEYALELLNYYKFGLDNATTEKTLSDTVDEYIQLGILDANTDADAFKSQIWYEYNFDNLAE